MTDTQGHVVVLHGLNMVYKRPPYYPAAIGFGDDDAAFLAAEGYDTVRVGVIYAAVEPNPGSYDDAYLPQIRKTVDTLGKHGIVSMLDFHQDSFSERFYGEGFPPWAIQDDNLPAQPNLGFGPNYLAMPALERALDHFWANDPGPGGVGLQDRYAAAWKHVAERFRDDPNVLGYELFNEPFPGTLWEPCANPLGCQDFDAKLTRFNAKMFGAIRGVDPRTLVWYEPNVLFNNGPATFVTSGTRDLRAGFAFHDYCLPEPNTGSDLGCDPFDDLVFNNALKHVGQTGDALLETEFGATDDVNYLRAQVDRADRDMVSWQEWHYCGCNDPTTSGPGDKQAIVLDPAKAPSGTNLKTVTLDELTRPYPQLVSGTPVSWNFDRGTRTFTAKWTTQRADGTGAFGAYTPSTVALPKRVFPDGYHAVVQGAAIMSAANARVLTLSTCPGATSVSVTVAPGGATTGGCPAPVLKVKVTPRTTVARRKTFFTVRVTVNGNPVPGVAVRVAGARATTSRTGRVFVTKRVTKLGKVVVAAKLPGYRSGRATIVVKRR